jgi:hypothetical protein
MPGVIAISNSRAPPRRVGPSASRGIPSTAEQTRSEPVHRPGMDCEEPSVIPMTPATLRIDPRFESVVSQPPIKALLLEPARMDGGRPSGL